MSRYMVDGRSIVVLALLAVTSILLAGASAVFTVQAKLETMKARAVVDRALVVTDSVASLPCPRPGTIR